MRRLIFFVLAVFLIAGCAKNEAEGPPNIRYGRNVCDECGMIIADRRFAAAGYDGTGEPKRFDDIGCAWRFMERSGKLARFWVGDYGGSGWIGGSAATYAFSEKFITPMGYGLAAFSGPEKAREILKDAAIFRWEGIGPVVDKKTVFYKGENT